MREYMLRLFTTGEYSGNWEWRFREQEDKNAVSTGALQLNIIGCNPKVTGAQLFRLEPTGTIKEFIHIFTYLVEQRVIVKDAGFFPNSKMEEGDG